MSRKRRNLLALCVVVCVAVATPAGDSVGATGREGGKVSHLGGRVTYPTGAAIRGVCVAVRHETYGRHEPKPHRTRTDADGRWRVNVRLHGTPSTFNEQFFETRFTGCTKRTRDLASAEYEYGPVLEPGQDRDDIDQEMVPAASISGRVASPGGKPLAGARVFLNHGSSLFFYLGANGNDNTLTDAHGRYRLDGLLPGPRYEVAFVPPNGVGLAPSYYAHTLRPNQSKELKLLPGQHLRHVDGRVAKAGSVRGQIVGDDGQPLEGVRLALTIGHKHYEVKDEAAALAHARSDASGRFTFSELAAHAYRLRINPSDRYGTPRVYLGETSIQPDATRIHVRPGRTVTLPRETVSRTSTVTGTVTSQSGEPIKGVCVSAYLPHRRRVPLSDLSGRARTDAAGRYRLTGVTGRRAVIFFDKCSQLSDWVSEYTGNSVRYRDASAIELAPGDTRAGIDAELAAGGMITGLVTEASGQPVENERVRVGGIGQGERDLLYNTSLRAKTGKDGRYELRGVPDARLTVHFDPHGADLGVNYTQSVLRSEYFDDAHVRSEARRLKVGLGGVRGGVDAALDLAAACSDPDRRIASARRRVAAIEADVRRTKLRLLHAQRAGAIVRSYVAEVRIEVDAYRLEEAKYRVSARRSAKRACGRHR